MRAAAFLALLLLAACGDDGPPLFPDGSPATVMENRNPARTVSTSAGWQGTH